jgi:hypothetical protein
MSEKKVENIVITEEYLKKIRKFAAIVPEETFVYTPTAFRSFPVEVQPKFVLSPITGEEALQFADRMRGEVFVENGKAEVHIKHGEYTISVVKKGLKSWSNYYDINGKIVDYVNGSIGNLPRDLLEELSDAITSKSQLTNEEILGLK